MPTNKKLLKINLLFTGDKRRAIKQTENDTKFIKGLIFSLGTFKFTETNSNILKFNLGPEA